MKKQVLQSQINENTIVNATKWAFNAEFFAKMIIPITNMILARILAPEVFGMIAIVNMIVSFTDMITNAGFRKFLIQHEYSSDIEFNCNVCVAFYTNLFLSIFLWIIIIVLKEPLACVVGCSGYGHVIAIACISLPITSFSSIQEALYMRNFGFKTLFYNRILVACLPFVITIPLALLGLGYWSLIIGTISGNVAKAVFLTIKSEWKPTIFFSIILLKKMISFSLWSILEAVTMWLVIWIDVFIVSQTFGAHYTGLYRTTQITVSGIISVITASTTSVLFSSLSRVQNERDEFIRIFYSFQRNVGMIVLPLGFGIFAFKTVVTRILLGENWLEASNFLGIWSLCTALVATYGSFCREVYCAKGKPKVSVLAQILHLLFLVPVCFLSRPLGYNFFIYSRAFASLQILIIHFMFMGLFMRIPVFSMIKQTIAPLGASVLMGGLGILLEYFFRGVFMMTFSVIFCCSFYFVFLCLIPSYRDTIIALCNKCVVIQKLYQFIFRKT